MSRQIALAGNPNSGKTTLFNRLTGSRQSTGNWPGVTVEKKTGKLFKDGRAIELVDLPGIYSLACMTPEETIARDFLTQNRPDLIINIVDVTNLERNLFLTLQLKKLGIPILIALNMMDELALAGDRVDSERLSALLEIPVFPVSARRGTGLNQLIDDLFVRIDAPKPPSTELTEAACTPEAIEAETEDLYRRASAIQAQVFYRQHPPGSLNRSDRIDRLLTNRFLAIPIFLVIMMLVFLITFNENLGGRLTKWLDVFFNDILAGIVATGLELAQAPAWLHSLLIEGIIAGVGGVLTFLPQIALLFLFLAILEDSGYMARAAFIMDRLFQHLGLSGRSFIPMLMGFGCTVPAIMATRTLENERERRLTILITPFMSCGARMPIYAYFTAVFFAAHKGLITFAMYLGGVLVAIIVAFVLSKTALRGSETTFIIELPPYRLPDAKTLLLHVWDKVRDFIVRAGTIIFLMTVLVWFLQSFDFRLRPVEDSSQSIFGLLGGILAPVFSPLGFGTWEATVALLTGLVAKESVVATLGIVYSEGALEAMFTPVSALAFMTFTLLYTPCVAAIGAMRREFGNTRWTIGALFFQTAVAWIFAFLVYRIGSLLASVF
ncbi:MAG: ferrous iron transport protein B [Clostridiaceae bacterium]|jgi:ferrous iron transport protein B|nr:ferrous iron transport protein B [Clostridiaceae bacterium]